MGAHPLTEFDQHTLRKRCLPRTETAQHHLPPRIQLRRHDRLGIADLVIGLEQRDHRQERGGTGVVPRGR
jgi:hypothetical protein